MALFTNLLLNIIILNGMLASMLARQKNFIFQWYCRYENTVRSDMLENLRGTVFLTGTFLFSDVHSLSFLSSD